MNPEEITLRCNKVIIEKLGVEDLSIITPEAKIKETLGADSLDTVELVMGLEEEFDIEIPEDNAEQVKTVGGIYDYIKKRLN